MNKSAFGVACLVGFSLTCAGLAAGLGQLEKNLVRDQRLSARRAGQAFLPAIRKAHRMKDDLALQEVLQGMASVPGVGYAGILSSEKRWIAHSQPTEIGQSFMESTRAKEALRLTLQEDSHPAWGTLMYTVSSQSLHQILRRTQAAAWSILILGWALLSGGAYLLTRRFQILTTQVDEWKTACHYEKQERERLILRLKTSTSEK